jgi:hypothetical protein
MKKLRFATHNRKINKLAESLGLKKTQVIAFDLPAGYTCPAADKCQSFSNRENGTITDGDNCQFRCYAASIECAFPSARRVHWHNYDILRKLTSDEMVKVILASLPANVKIVRIHSSGDYFSKRYFQAWVKVAESLPDVKFFGYTKILNYVNAPKPDNYRLVYSFGGTMDSKKNCEPTCYVVKNIADAISRGLVAACVENPADDYNFIMEGRTFALCLHGTQPAKKRRG